MNQTITAKLTHGLALAVAVVLVLLPFHAFLTVWLASAIGHYTVLRLWKEFVLLAVSLVALGLLVRDAAMRKALRSQQLMGLIGVYILLQLFLGATSLAHHQVSGKALAYGLLDDTRFLLFFILCAGIVARDDWLRKHWRPLVVVPAMLVVAFGLLEIFVLPHNFLQHFGYGPSTITPFETVNSNAHYVRVQSTLRGANPLGAYLVLVVAVMTVLLVRSKVSRQRLGYGLGLIATLIVLYFSYSRGAWIGTVLSLACIAAAVIKNKRSKQLVALGSVVVLVIAIIGVWSLRNNMHFQDVIFHTSPHTVATTSDQNHDSALKQGLQDVAHDPLGRGPGTAGPASVYNTRRPARIAENYFVQIGQEVGWLGLGLFLIINAILAFTFWQLRANSLALALGASLVGISFVGLLSNVWTDDTLSYLWWGLAGIAWSVHLLPQKTKGH